MSADFEIVGDFVASEVSFVPVSQIARQYLARIYGAGCVSFNVKKSLIPVVVRQLEIQGLIAC